MGLESGITDPEVKKAPDPGTATLLVVKVKNSKIHLSVRYGIRQNS
jgi:hypothetical protein